MPAFPACASSFENVNNHSPAQEGRPFSSQQLATNRTVVNRVQAFHEVSRRSPFHLVREHNILSPCQKGFTPHDGILEHNFVLQQSLEQARLQRKELCIAWLDVTNAFGALPHSAIFEALSAAGTDDQFLDLIRDIYSDATTQILSGLSTTRPIEIKSGVKQGCPISGLLFNICVDPVIRSIQENASAHRVLAFADDVCLLAS
ncbi:hypothetical protein AVEN_59366-1 [Araneus ventricosus]|uniref:Reverse transcriptase domain-containing protein n=1 Tax=Araneus ventricosus TaxID=182803 RepID=A0A4Y2TV56_ARAVE|nr:hypothetical protein AVEN_59366-1 [Araneus ventricosus]